MHDGVGYHKTLYYSKRCVGNITMTIKNAYSIVTTNIIQRYKIHFNLEKIRNTSVSLLKLTKRTKKKVCIY